MFDSLTAKAKTLTRKVSSGNVEYPTKTTINLVVTDEETAPATPVTVVAFAVVMVLIILFAKFGVVDMLSAASSASSQVSSLQSQVAQLQETNSQYSSLKEELEQYAIPGANEEEATFASREQALKVAQTVSGLGGQLQSVTLSGNTVQIQLGNTTLGTVTEVVDKINTYDWVQSAQPNTAGNSDDSKKVTATITVELVPSAAGQASSDSAQDTASADDSVEGEE